MDGYYKEVVKVLSERGYHKVRQKGSHQIWRDESTGASVTVSTNMKSRQTANEIMKQARINHKF